MQIQKQEFSHKDFGKRLRSEREKQGLTVAHLSEIVDIEQSYIIQVEHGEKPLSIQNLVSLLLALGLSADTLLFGTKSDIGKQEKSIDKFMHFFSTQSDEELSALFELVKNVSKYKAQPAHRSDAQGEF